jgi:hypothetical protein
VTTPATAGLLRSIFADARASALFTILRNGEALPDGLSGRDLDVSTLPGHSPAHVVAFLLERARAAGWTPICLSRRPHMTAISFVAGLASDAIHFDIFDGITYACIPLLEPALLADESAVRDGVRMLRLRGRVLATLAHHLAWNGGLTKAGYRDEVAAVLADPADRDWLLYRVHALFGERIAGELAAPRGGERLGTDLRRRRRAARRALLGRSLRRAPAATLGGLARYALGQLPSLAVPPGLIGERDDPLPGTDVPLDLSLACRIAPHGFGIDAFRTAHGARTLNGPRYERTLARSWARWAPVRWIAPSIFLWFQAKRGRVVVVERLPVALRVLRRTARPAWLAASAAAAATEARTTDRMRAHPAS